jgi:hypothetical protein
MSSACFPCLQKPVDTILCSSVLCAKRPEQDTYISPLGTHISFSITHIGCSKDCANLIMVCWKVCCASRKRLTRPPGFPRVFLAGVPQSEAHTRHSGNTGTSKGLTSSMMCGGGEDFVVFKRTGETWFGRGRVTTRHRHAAAFFFGTTSYVCI